MSFPFCWGVDNEAGTVPFPALRLNVLRVNFKGFEILNARPGGYGLSSESQVLFDPSMADRVFWTPAGECSIRVLKDSRFVMGAFDVTATPLVSLFLRRQTTICSRCSAWSF